MCQADTDVSFTEICLKVESYFPLYPSLSEKLRGESKDY